MKAYIGIDLGKRSVAAICPEGSKKAWRHTLTFESSADECSRLIKWVEQRGVTDPTFVMEASGIYWVVLYAWLLHNNFKVSVIRSAAPLHWARSYNKRTKNDVCDARTIAEFGAERRLSPETKRLEGYDLREAARYLVSLVEDAAALKNKVHRYLAVVFPELLEVFRDPCRKTALALLYAYPTANDLAQAGVELVSELKIDNRRLGRKRAEKLVKLAERSIGRPATVGFHSVELRSLIGRIRAIHTEQRELEAWIEQNANTESLDLLQSFPGCGKALSVRILAEIGDPHRFSSADKVVAYAGLNPREHSSGGRGKPAKVGREPSWRMSKQGNTRLRHALYLVCLRAVREDPRFKEFYQRKVKGDDQRPGKKPKVALGHCMRKALVILWSLLKKGERYDCDRVKAAA